MAWPSFSRNLEQYTIHTSCHSIGSWLQFRIHIEFHAFSFRLFRLLADHRCHVFRKSVVSRWSRTTQHASFSSNLIRTKRYGGAWPLTSGSCGSSILSWWTGATVRWSTTLSCTWRCSWTDHLGRGRNLVEGMYIVRIIVGMWVYHYPALHI